MSCFARDPLEKRISPLRCSQKAASVEMTILWFGYREQATQMQQRMPHFDFALRAGSSEMTTKRCKSKTTAIDARSLLSGDEGEALNRDLCAASRTFFRRQEVYGDCVELMHRCRS
jgi:hypothetical protein